MAPCSLRRRSARRRDDSRAWFMHECSHVIFAPRQTHDVARHHDFPRGHASNLARNPRRAASGRLAHREGPSLGDVLSEREVVEIHVKPIRHPIRRHTHLADGRSADLRLQARARGPPYRRPDRRSRLDARLQGPRARRSRSPQRKTCDPRRGGASPPSRRGPRPRTGAAEANARTRPRRAPRRAPPFTPRRSSTSPAPSRSPSHSSACARNSARGISRAPNRRRCSVSTWQSMSSNPRPRSHSIDAAKATFDASGRSANIDSPKNAAPSETP